MAVAHEFLMNIKIWIFITIFTNYRRLKIEKKIVILCLTASYISAKQDVE